MAILTTSRLAAIAVAAVLAACGSKVPDIEDPKNPVVNGKAMTQREFLDTYCVGEDRRERSCALILDDRHKNATRGEMPKW